MAAEVQVTELEQVYRAVHTLYNDSNSIPMSDKQAASSWLNDFQRSVKAWEIADQLLHKKMDLYSCYFGAHTLRTKIQGFFHELPLEAHLSLRDSLLQHIAAISSDTDHIIVTQLCLAVAHLILQASTWADPISHLLGTFGSDPSHWWPVVEILTLLPEEVHSRKLHLGENRRHQVNAQLESASPNVLNFLRQCLTVSLGNSAPPGVPTDLLKVSILKCFASWVTSNPDCFCNDRQGEVLRYAVENLRSGKAGQKIHTASTDCICAVIEVVPDIDASSNNNALELQSFQLNLYTSIISFEEAYHYSVAEEDQDKVMNYCRIFTEYGESMIPYMLRSWRDPHYSINIINYILICEGHHDYDVAELTFGFWYRLSEDLYHAHDESLNAVFRSFAQRLVVALYKHCQMEPDHEGPLTSSDEFYEFRRKASELVEDIMFIVNSQQAFQELGQLFIMENSWECKESALFLLYHVARSIDTRDSTVIGPIVEAVLNFTDWRHISLKISAIRFLGGMSAWLAKHPDDVLEKTMNFLVNSLPATECSSTAAAALQNVCQQCADHIAGRYINNLLTIVGQLDTYNVCNDAVVGLLKGVGHVVGTLPRDQLSQIIRQICWAQLHPLNQLCDTDASSPYQKGTKSDPTFWIDRLAALFRNTSVQNSRDGTMVEHPCKPAICEDVWPVISKVLNKYQADSRVMERVCRCVRYAVRCVGRHSHPFLEPLVMQLVALYGAHHHSCFLYLGSILVDEYGEDAQCVEGLLQMLAAFIPPTFAILNEPSGLRNHPDTVDDFFRLCTRFLQRCPIALLKSDILSTLVTYATQATQLDHREANMSVVKFLFDLVHAGRRHNDLACFAERKTLVRNTMMQHGPNLITMLIHGVIFQLPTYTIGDICELLYEIKEMMPKEYASWIENALKQLPENTPAGTQAATLTQLESFHKQATGARSPKELSRSLKDFCRLYR
ncbi:Transportin-3 [Orchesella cincta]|uniref:Transportin-3 n=1 Tax=Orchesella cincta TaxID=48709 RepID=A0A1D2MDF2_ORCCI|nr:Transportin-3 [Orchesella cincta]